MFSSKVDFEETPGGPCIGAAIWNITNNDPDSPGADTDWKDLERLGGKKIKQNQAAKSA